MAQPGTENHGTEKYWHGMARKIRPISYGWKIFFRNLVPFFMGEKYFQEFGPIFYGWNIFSGIWSHFLWEKNIFRDLVKNIMISWKQKRCATSVQSIWRWYRAEISTMCQKTKVFVLDKFLWVENIFRYQDPGTARHGNIWHGTNHEGTARKYLARHGSWGHGTEIFGTARIHQILARHGTGRPCPNLHLWASQYV